MFNTGGGLELAEPETMPTKKATEKPKPRQEIILVYKADTQAAGPFKEWLEGLADAVGAPVTVTLDMALKEFAAARKFRAMPKRLVRREK